MEQIWSQTKTKTLSSSVNTQKKYAYKIMYVHEPNSLWHMAIE